MENSPQFIYVHLWLVCGILKRSKIMTSFVISGTILLCLSGCVVIGGERLADEPIGKKWVEMIRPGQTHIREIMTRLGSPVAIARQRQTMVFPPPGMGKRGYLEIQPDAFFELFSSNRILREEEVVYYYQSSRKTDSGLFMFFIVINGGGVVERINAERLWLLVNERTGLIEDFVYRSAVDGGYVTSQASESGSR